MKKLLFLSVCTLTLPCGAQTPPSSLKTTFPRTLSGRGVIFPAPIARTFADQCSRVSPSGWWTTVAPSETEIARLEKALPLWMKSVAGAQKSRQMRWNSDFKTYIFQYGALIRGGKRLIYINAAPAGIFDKDPVWRREPEMVCDGGASFWGVEWDVKSGKFQNLAFNGPA